MNCVLVFYLWIQGALGFQWKYFMPLSTIAAFLSGRGIIWAVELEDKTADIIWF
jgi:hypothetical protein